MALAAILMALLLSGAAGVANQIAWQRGLRIFLASSTTLSNMVVVLVFMLGLGCGAALMALWLRRIARPLHALAVVESLLAGAGIAIAMLLSADVGEAMAATQRFALAVGMPLLGVHIVSALLVLTPATLLMGATLPLASHVCQHQLGASRSSLIAYLFFVNTAGAVIGSYAAGFLLLPYFGQLATLLSSAGTNLLAAGVLWALASRSPAGRANVARAHLRPERGPPVTRYDTMAFVLGGLALAYEMYLLRMVALRYEPVPQAFASTLCAYLLCWSAGVFLAGRVRNPPTTRYLACFHVLVSALVVLSPIYYAYDRWTGLLPPVFGLAHFLPCVGFGFLFGTLVSRHSQNWGIHVARFYAFNTAGSCVGIVAFTLGGYEMSLLPGASLIAFGVLWLAVFQRHAKDRGGRDPERLLQSTIAVAMGAVAYFGATARHTETPETGRLTYWGRDGVVEITSSGDVYLDGLWHTHLSDGTNHLGEPFNWLMAAAPILAHGEGAIATALVVGNGVGITASTLAGLPAVRVDAYEINHTLKHVLQDFSDGTLAVAANPRVTIHWTDARSGLVLDPKDYDIIVTSPLHLRQAGSSMLLSVEYLRLLKKRLKPGGVISLYAKERDDRQAALIRRTVASVFAHRRSFDDQEILVASDRPIRIDRQRVARLLRSKGRFAAELAAVDRQLRNRYLSAQGILVRMDQEANDPLPPGPIVTDDWPLVEYPGVLEGLDE